MQKIIITGFGFMGAMHAQAYREIRSATVTAIVDRNRKSAAAKMRQLGLKVPLYETLGEALESQVADVVDICVPTPHHLAAVRIAVAAGKNVFCEKPLALGAREVRAIVALVRRTGIKMQVGQCIRFWPEYQVLENLVRQNRLGRLLSLSLQRRSARPSHSVGGWMSEGNLSGGGAFDLHIHDTDFVHHLLGRPRAVSSVGTEDSTGWSHLFTTYHFDGVAVTAEGGWNYPEQWGFQMAFQAVFERGAVEFDSNANPSLAFTPEKGKRRALPLPRMKIERSKVGGGNVSALGGYLNELNYFIRCLEKNMAPRIATPEQAAESVRTVLAEMRSARTGRTIKLQGRNR